MTFYTPPLEPEFQPHSLFPYTKSVYKDCKPEAPKENPEGLWTLMRKQITPLFSLTYNWNSSFPSIIGETTNHSGISSTHDYLQQQLPILTKPITVLAGIAKHCLHVLRDVMVVTDLALVTDLHCYLMC